MANNIQLNEIYKALEGVAKKAKEESVVKAFKKEGKRIRQQAVQAAPRGETGNLKKGIKLKTKQRGLMATVGSTAPHSHLVEFGHENVKRINKFLIKKLGSRTPAHPFMRPMWDREKARSESNITEDIKRDLDL